MTRRPWLNDREREVLHLFESGVRIKEIAIRWNASLYTPKKTLERARKKLKDGAKRSVDLPPRHKQILSLMAIGFCRKQIAERLQISEKTIAYYWTAIQKRFHCDNGFSVALRAREAGII